MPTNQPDHQPEDQELINALRRRGRADLKQALAAREAKFTQQDAPPAKVRRFPRWAIAAALLPLLGLALWALLPGKSVPPQQLAQDYAFAYPNVVTQPVLRAEGEPPASALAAALQTYEQGDLTAAAQSLASLSQTDTTTFYRGVIALRQSGWSDGCSLMNNLPASGGFALPARYYRALCLLEGGDVEAAKALLLPVTDWEEYPGLKRRVEEVLRAVEK